MPRTPEERSRDISLRYAEDPGYALTLSQKARERWNREHRAEIEAALDEFEDGRLQRRLIIGLRAMARTIEDGHQLDDQQKKFVRAVRGLREGSMFNAASTPYVSETQTRHEWIFHFPYCIGTGLELPVALYRAGRNTGRIRYAKEWSCGIQPGSMYRPPRAARMEQNGPSQPGRRPLRDHP